MNGKEPVIPDLDPCYLALGGSDEERRLRYREFVQSAIPIGEWELIQEAIARGHTQGIASILKKLKK